MDLTGFYQLGKKIPETRLTPIAILGERKGRRGLWYTCSCECGKETTVSPNEIRNGSTKSCGCYKLERARANKTHGLSKRPEYFAALQAFDRCYDKSDPSYRLYGGRGIRCLFKSSVEMATWLVNHMPRPKGGRYMLDRIDNAGHYAKDNLKWSTPIESARNRRCTRWVKILGVRKSLMEWVRENNICGETLKHRIETGVPEELWLFKGKITKAVLFDCLNRKSNGAEK